MTDWKAAAAARGLPIPPAQLELVAARLAALEQIFRPLTGEIPPELDPAPLFRADPEGE